MRNLLFFAFLIKVSFSFGQQKCWIFLSDKDSLEFSTEVFVSEAAVEKRMLLEIPIHQYSDIPVSKRYLGRFKRIWNKCRASIEMDECRFSVFNAK